MSPWNDLIYPFREALIDAFDVDGLAQMIRYHCDGRELEQLTGKNQRRPKIVDDVIADAARNGWLAGLAQGALKENPTHSGLQNAVPALLEGIDRIGPADPESPDTGLRPYLAWMAQRSERLALSLLDPGGTKTAKLELAKVFINLNVAPREWVLSDKPGFMARERAALAAVHAERQLILLGDPGSGKSTLLHFLVYCLAQEALAPQAGWRRELKWQCEIFPRSRREGSRDDEKIETEDHHWTADAPLPVLIELRDFAATTFDPRSPLALWHYLEQHLAGRGLEMAVAPLAAQAQAGNVILLLDGVDEVPAGRRRDVWQAIAALADGAYSHCRWVATCRILSFDAGESPQGVAERTLQPLTDEQIEHFIGCWYTVMADIGELGADRAEALATGLQQQMQREALQELARNPMLLTIMAIVQTYYGTLPEARARLYQACVETLLLRWQMPKEGAEEGKVMPDLLAALGVNQQKLERLLWEIAWVAHTGAVARKERANIREGNIMPIAARHLGDYDKAEKFLAYTEQRAHLLVGRGGIGERVFAFPHRTFQEYLAACYLTPGMRLLKEAPGLAEAGDTWREVLNLAAGALVYNNNNFEQVLFAVERMVPRARPSATDTPAWHRIWLAGEMATVVGRQNFEESDFAGELLPQLRQQLVALLVNEALTPAQRAEAGDALGLLGDPRSGVCTLEPDLIPIAAGDFIYGDGQTRTIQHPYAIARYPVTVAQFGLFIVGNGYDEPRYWGGEDSPGWRWRVKDHPEYRGKGPITRTCYWQQPDWHVDNRPVVGVSWYEATAYCAWLTEKTGREYRLPAEEEWERAARHTDGREWAWGNEWRDGIINSREAGIGRTTAVGCFPRGAAECGAVDMSGNVWEWTASLFQSGSEWYIVRGGSWGNDQNIARVALRLYDIPNYSDDSIGIRVVSPVVF